jgi:hypothetical protein
VVAHPVGRGLWHPVGRGLAAYAGLIAVSAYYGAAGLVFGFLPGLDVLRPRLPLDSAVVGGLALLCVVAIPATVTAVLAWRHDPRAARASVVAGGLLVGWIVVEVLVVRMFSPLQPVCALLGLGLMLWGDRTAGVRPVGRSPGSSRS